MTTDLTRLNDYRGWMLYVKAGRVCGFCADAIPRKIACAEGSLFDRLASIKTAIDRRVQT